MPAEAPSADLAATLGGLRVERESPALAAALRTGSAVDPGGATIEPPDRIALIAAWSPSARLSRSASALVAAIQSHGYQVIFGSASEDDAELAFHPDAAVDPGALTVVRRANVGYDFGTWAVLMEQYAPLLTADKVLVLNDSLIGPFASLTPIIEHFEATSADVWGLVESGQFTNHLQSFFRGFRYGCLAEPPMRRFWQGIRRLSDKDAIIEVYEYGFSAHLRDGHFSAEPFVDFRGLVDRRENPTIAGWRGLLDAGVPFVKRELVRRPELAPDGHDVAAVLQDRFGVTLTDWV